MAMTAANRRYVLRTWIFMGAYIALNLGAMFDILDSVQPPGTWLLAAAVSAQIAGQIWATLAFIQESDEFVRALTAKRFIVASGVAMSLFSFWGFLESYAAAPHIPGWMIYPLFWVAFCFASPFIRSTRA
ncbi:hypothetical protein LRS10_08365 [Phenylobacterium sp. J426]|uniref:hypothetical protein n=1 Tax=Phenylobacterium sp. J426 TaxID=2898439 RepID=UPI002151BFA5|nr:hypothetical protein [Phenylobacterium sp. J426]MCR5874172.1 hypothetical protein [Phenylobacterium sp. J426]